MRFPINQLEGEDCFGHDYDNTPCYGQYEFIGQNISISMEGFYNPIETDKTYRCNVCGRLVIVYQAEKDYYAD